MDETAKNVPGNLPGICKNLPDIQKGSQVAPGHSSASQARVWSILLLGRLNTLKA